MSKKSLKCRKKLKTIEKSLKQPKEAQNYRKKLKISEEKVSKAQFKGAFCCLFFKLFSIKNLSFFKHSLFQVAEQQKTVIRPI